MPPDAPLRNPETGSIIVDSPFMDSLLVMITIVFLVGGIGYGIGAKTLRGSPDVIDAITKTFAGLSGLIFLLLIIAQFIAYFNYSNMATVLASSLADALKRADIGAALVAAAVHLRDVLPEHHDPRHPAEVGDLRSRVRPAVLAARRRAADGARGLPRRRLADERHHAADGVPAVHRHHLPALQEGLRRRHGRVADAAVHHRGR